MRINKLLITAKFLDNIKCQCGELSNCYWNKEFKIYIISCIHCGYFQIYESDRYHIFHKILSNHKKKSQRTLESYD